MLGKKIRALRDGHIYSNGQGAKVSILSPFNELTFYQPYKITWNLVQHRTIRPLLSWFFALFDRIRYAKPTQVQAQFALNSYLDIHFASIANSLPIRNAKNNAIFTW